MRTNLNFMNIVKIQKQLLQEKFDLSQNDLEKKDLLSQTLRASILRQLINGEELTNRIKIQGNLPFKFQKSENLVWLFQNVDLFELDAFLFTRS